MDGLDTLETAHQEIAARVGVVFQDPESQLVMDRVEDDVAFGLENRAWPLPGMRRRVPEALAELGLEGYARRRSTRLSGGQQQRLALAGVLTPQPGILVLDEPTANLDPGGAAGFFVNLDAVRAARRTTIVLIEHRVELAWPLADRILVLGRDGRPIDAGAPAEVVGRSGARMVQEGIWLPETIEAAVTGRRGAPSPAPRSAPAAIGGEGPAQLAQAADVSFGYEQRRLVLHDVSLDIGRGERIGLVGPNGSGKSTLGRLLVGLLRPDRGRLLLSGADPARLPAAELARQAGYVFQNPEQQFLADTVRHEVLLGLRPEEVDGAAALMAVLGLPLETFGKRSPYTLSGGEQRRLSLACVLVRRPRLLVLDEPTFGQDRLGYEGLLEVVRDRIEAGATVIAATHDLRFVRDFATRRLVLEDGRLVADEPAAGPTERPADRLAAAT